MGQFHSGDFARFDSGSDTAAVYSQTVRFMNGGIQDITLGIRSGRAVRISASGSAVFLTVEPVFCRSTNH